ncbi:gamma-glutamylcyclotransferase family protein [Nitratireductor luteus]|uniref:gamma-glutamylcyclotransferase family protein n=1 Tax=Nitratireductor luteus TaxID=2976980 RepID=UPI00223F69FD|nr:gamma-glutamylcyclotransferase family protein [Nitratireductor luteus]
MAEGAVVGYFGYGSLVNADTHRTRIVASVPARLKGWRRHWIPHHEADMRSAVLLSVKRDEAHVCDGLLVLDRLENLPQVDEREIGYLRRQVQRQELELEAELPFDCPLYVYEALPPATKRDAEGHILQSYLDAVLQGFLRVHGEEGMRRFVSDTHGFDTPVLADRDAPLYPRPVRLSEAERELIDSVLAQLPVCFIRNAGATIAQG